jgi:Flp pilus assembly protein CpaB
MWIVKRMNTARIVVLTIALGAGGIAAYLASGSDNKPPAEPVARLQTVDVLVAKSDIGLGQSVTPEDLQWQTWPASTASNSFIRRNGRPEATTGTLSLALRSIVDLNATGTRSDDQAPKRGDAINVVRYGISSLTTTQK